MTKPIYQYQIQMQGTLAVNLLAGDPIADKIQVYNGYAPSQDTVEKMFHEGAVMFYVRAKSDPKTHLIVLSPEVTERIPSMMLPTQMQATQVVNKCDALINEAFLKAKLGDRKTYEHLIVGLPDTHPAVPV